MGLFNRKKRIATNNFPYTFTEKDFSKHSNYNPFEITPKFIGEINNKMINKHSYNEYMAEQLKQNVAEIVELHKEYDSKIIDKSLPTIILTKDKHIFVEQKITYVEEKDLTTLSIILNVYLNEIQIGNIRVVERKLYGDIRFEYSPLPGYDNFCRSISLTKLTDVQQIISDNVYKLFNTLTYFK